MVLTMLASGASPEAVLEAYPVLGPADIDACLLYAARLSEVAAAEGGGHSLRKVSRLHAASWKMTPRVKRSPLRTRLTPWRMLTR